MLGAALNGACMTLPLRRLMGFKADY